jgi:hypothetical protein
MWSIAGSLDSSYAGGDDQRDGRSRTDSFDSDGGSSSDGSLLRPLKYQRTSESVEDKLMK